LSTSRFQNQFDAEPYVGNGYFSQRIPAAGMGFVGSPNPIGWPLGTPRFTDALAAGLYANTTASLIYPNVSKQVIALIPTWSTLTFSTPSGHTYSPADVTAAQISNYVQSENLQTGTVTTSGVWTSPDGKQASFTYQVFTDRARKHVGVVSLTLTPRWSGPTNVTSLLDGQGASRLQAAGAGVDLATHTSHVSSTALGTAFPVAESATLRFALHRFSSTAVGLDKPQTAGEQLSFTAKAGHAYVFTKYVAVVTGRDSTSPTDDARTDSLQAAGLGLPALRQENAAAWADVWNGDIVVNGDLPLQTAIHANTYDLYASIRNDSPDTIGPSGLSSDGYAGMVFWDSDIWMFPAILAAHPDIARVAVDYRFNTLQAAEHDANSNGPCFPPSSSCPPPSYKGAFYPWTAGDDGFTGADCYGTVTDANDKITFDPNKSCSEEVHLQADIALAQWEYYQATGDQTWLAQHGWPVLQALAEFWVSKAVPTANGGYAIDTVQPPDEFHTDVNNSAYTNAAAATALQDATNAARVVGAAPPAIWTTVANGLKQTMPFDLSLNIYDEFDGYHGDTVKQADVVMLTYPLDFPMSSSVGLSDLNYYAQHTSLQGPAMTDAIHSIDASALNAPGCSAYTYMLGSYEPFLRPPYDQFAETRSGGDTGFNFLTGVGGFSQVFEYGFSGLRFGADAVTLDPSLPPQVPGVTLTNLQWHGSVFTVAIGPKSTTVSLSSGPALPVMTPTGQQTVGQGRSITIPTRRPDLQPTKDLARCQRVSASSFVPGDDPVAAVDGSTATAWVATDPQATLTVQLAKRATLTSATITRGGSFGPFGYRLETSTDGSNWHVVATAPATSSGVDQFRFAPTQALFVRLSFPGGAGAAAPDIDELTVSGGHRG
jgi:trehalose/maltose hydrolase-like predicted phosphorylase